MKTLLLKKQCTLFFVVSILYTTQPLFAQSGSSDNATMQSFGLEFNSVDGPIVNRTLELSFSPNTSDSYDEGYDNKNLQVENDDLNLVLNGEPMTSQAFGPITEDKIVPLIFQASGSYNYTIQLSWTDNMGGQNIELRDNLLGSTFNLIVGQAYQFSSVAGNFPNRFELTFKNTTLSQESFEIESINMSYLTDSKSIRILNPNNVNITCIEVYSITGKRVFKNQNSNNNSIIDYQVTNVNSGIYILRLTTESNGILVKKIIAK